MSLLMLTHFAQIRIGRMCMDSLEIRQMLAHAKPSNDAFVWWSMSLIASNLYWWKFIHWDGFDSESWFFTGEDGDDEQQTFAIDRAECNCGEGFAY